MDSADYRSLAVQLYNLTFPGRIEDFSHVYHYQKENPQRIKAITIDASLTSKERKAHLFRGMQKLLSGISGQSGCLILRVQSTGDGTISLEVGYYNHNVDRQFLDSGIQGFIGTTVWGDKSELVAPIEYTGYVRGIPTVLSSEEEKNEVLSPVMFLDAICSGMLGEAFALTIVAQPFPASKLMRNEARLWGEMDNLKPLLHTSRQISKSVTSNRTETEGSNAGSGMEAAILGSEGESQSSSNAYGLSETEQQTLNYDSVGHIAIDKTLKQISNRFRRAALEGAWRVGIFIGARSISSLDKLGSIAVGALVGEEDAVEAPSWRSISQGRYLLEGEWPDNIGTPDEHLQAGHELLNFLTSRELAAYISFPANEFPGYEILPTPSFGLQPKIGDLNLGQVMNNCRTLGDLTVSIGTQDLLKHGLIVGMTGSGKTNTVFHLLSQINVPFLVIEPVKTEYRSMVSQRKDVRVYTLGDERTSPFRLNPFWFPAGLSLQQHVDNLKALFSASFSMYASMPNILEQCLYNVYSRKGWSLQHSTNIYSGQKDIALSYYPTLDDLYQEIDDYLTKSGYAEEQKQNIRSALLTRLKSLMTGGKGLLLNTAEVVDDRELFNHPTILELDGIPDDDEKALVIGLLIIKLYEYLKMSIRKESEELRHLLILEEAHRIFKNVSLGNNNPEVANPIGKMVEMFSNMLAEIRAYGQGVLVVEQIPTKLMPDAVKNTSFKIVHRLVSRDDCEYISTALSITPDEAQFCSRLRCGEALFFTEGMNKPVHLDVESAKQLTDIIPNKVLKEKAIDYNPLLNKVRYQHPLVEIILQDVNAINAAMLLTKMFARNLLYDNADHFYSARLEAIRKFIVLAEEFGYDLMIDKPEEFSLSLLNVCLKKLGQENPFIKKNLRVQSFITEYLTRLVEFAQYPYVKQAKSFDQFIVTRNFDLYTMLQRLYSITLSNKGKLSDIIVKLPASYVDGEAVLLMESWSEEQILKLLPEKECNLDEIIERVRDAVVKSFMLPPANMEAVKLMTVKIVIMLLGDKLTTDIVDRMCSIYSCYNKKEVTE